MGGLTINNSVKLTTGGARGYLGELNSAAGTNTWAGNITYLGIDNHEGSIASIGANANSTLVITGAITTTAATSTTAGGWWGKFGPGVVSIRSAQSWPGTNRIIDGALDVQCDGALGGASVPGDVNTLTLMSSLAVVGSGSTKPGLTFTAPASSPGGFSYNEHRVIQTSTNTTGPGNLAVIHNISGANTFAGDIEFSQVIDPSGRTLGAEASSSLELSGKLYSTFTSARTLVKVGAGEIIISGANTSANGIIGTAANYALTSGSFIVSQGQLTLRGASGSLTGGIRLQVNPGATLSLDNTLAASNSRVGPVDIAGGAFKLLGNASASVNQVLSGGTITGNSALTIIQPAAPATVKTILTLAANSSASRVASLSISTGAKLDLTSNKLIVAGGDIGSWNGSAYTGVTGMLQSGRGDGSWNGDGIVTSMSDATAGVLTTLAVSRADDAGYANSTFGGVSVAGNDVLVMYTWGGDANLDGQLNGDDYFALDSHILQSGSVFGFSNGDFNYDGVIDGDDYFVIDSNITYAQASGILYSAAGDIAAVPEPALLTLLPLMLLAGARRRRAG